MIELFQSLAEAVPAAPIPTRSLFDMLVAGGPLMIPILLASFVMLLIVFERLISLRRRRVVPRLFVERFLLQLREGALDRDEALERCEDESSHIARVFAAAVRKWGKPAVEVEQAVLDEGERIANVLRRYLRVLNGVSTVSPLLGPAGHGVGHDSSVQRDRHEPGDGPGRDAGRRHQRRPDHDRGRAAGRDSRDDLLPVFRRPRRQPGHGNRPPRPGARESDFVRGARRPQDAAPRDCATQSSVRARARVESQESEFFLRLLALDA